ncbi:hypothetical protein [Bradyrhizobium ivorense]|uniref:hypothetical protein n=1 Tax=Bradyrhizobium ivorense TaxID=2511166 RepID=UPI0010AFA688|nr:hypothetical protein [Bradyrhizobium ivorense]VIO73840.1 hypothetical protein CI41S_39490 [Bradyrhizobium ivorense]
MKAFAVLEDQENTGAIIFADHAIVARRRGADEYNGGELRGISCRRAPWADRFAGEPVPASVMIGNGWHFECGHCGARIDTDYLDEEDLPLDGVIGTQHSIVYCSAICEAEDNLERAIRADHQRRAIEALSKFVRRRFPGVTVRTDDNNQPHAYAAQLKGVWQIEQVVVSFDFPGMKIAPAQCRIDRRDARHEKMVGPTKPYFTCCGGDKEAFEAFARETKAAA